MTDQQMELGLNGANIKLASRREQRITRAGWWFAKMRRIVDDAMEWQPMPQPRAEQTWFAAAQRQIKI